MSSLGEVFRDSLKDEMDSKTIFINSREDMSIAGVHFCGIDGEKGLKRFNSKIDSGLEKDPSRALVELSMMTNSQEKLEEGLNRSLAEIRDEDSSEIVKTRHHNNSLYRFLGTN